MNDARWERIQQLVEAALELAPDRRATFVASACDVDTALRDEVLSLLEADAVDDLPAPWLGSLAVPETDRFAAGDRVAGRYVIRNLIGRGGMGEVYEASDEDLGITVALKTLRDVGTDEALLDRLKLEGRMARAVWHPNVCRVYELGRHDDDGASLWFLAMERLHGPTLQERLRETSPLPLERAVRIAEEIAAGLAAAHRAGVVHRDLKPGNVMLVERDGDEHAVITDFGTSRALARTGHVDGELRPGVVVGTPGYMAPELVRGDEAGPAADIYALGVVLFEMVTGSTPFADEETVALDEPWAAAIQRCLEHDPRRRFTNAEDVAAALTGKAQAILHEPGNVRVSALPAERDSFVGRESDLDALEQARNSGTRLMTLVGPGGMGKTRLAIHFAVRSEESWPGGIRFCELTEAKDIDGVASAVGVALGVQLARGDVIRQLGHAIAGRGACLIVLDNFEQVVAHAAATVGRWRELAPRATFLVTSRERLALEGEWTRAVEPLTGDAALELLTVRARGLRPGLEVRGSDEAAAREIVRLLDGIPLAIELAAARIRVMGLAQILEGTRKRFQLLAGGSGARHETLEAAIDGSWDLLAPWERAACAQCAVFEGGFTLEAAIAVLDLTAWPDAPPVVDVVWSLVDKSLLRTWVPAMEPGGTLPEVRFGMYVSLQEYARARLSAMDESATEVRHGAHFARYGATEALEALDRKGGAATRTRLERELENVVAACRRAIRRGDGATIASTYRAAWQVHITRGPLSTALSLGKEAAEDSRLQGLDRAIVVGTLSETAWYVGRFEDTIEYGEEALAIAREFGYDRLAATIRAFMGRAQFSLGRVDSARVSFESAIASARSTADRAALSAALNGYGMMQHELGHVDEARAAYEEGVAIARAIGDRRLEAVITTSLGILHQRAGRLEEAGIMFETSLAHHRDVGNRRSEALTLNNLGSLMTDQGRPAEARACAEAALRISREIGARGNEGISLAVLGEMAIELGELDEARQAFDASLVIHRELGARGVEGIILANLARIHELSGELDAAHHGYLEALAIHREVGDRHYEAGSLTSLAGVLLALGRGGEARDSLARAAPVLREVGASQELARALCIRAEVEHALGHRDAARASLDEAESIATTLGTRSVSELGHALAKARSVLAGAPGAPASAR